MMELLTIKNIRECTNLSRNELAFRYEIPLELLAAWEEGAEEPPAYLYNIFLSALDFDGYLEYSPISTNMIQPIFDNNCIINPIEWKAKHPHFNGFIKKLDCGCHAKLLAVEPTRKDGTTRICEYARFSNDDNYDLI